LRLFKDQIILLRISGCKWRSKGEADAGYEKGSRNRHPDKMLVSIIHFTDRRAVIRGREIRELNC